MSLNTFQKVEKQKERQFERDQHLDFMSRSGSSDSSTNNLSNSDLRPKPHGEAIKTARDFLWDDGDDSYESEESYEGKIRQHRDPSSYPPREAFRNEVDDVDVECVSTDCSRPKVSVMQKAHAMATNLPRFMTGTGTNHEQISMGRNSRTPSAFVGNAGHSVDDDTEEFVNTKRRAKTHLDYQKSRRRRWVIGVITIFLILFLSVYLRDSNDESNGSTGSEGPGDEDVVSPPDNTGSDVIPLPPGSPQPPINKDAQRFEAVLERITNAGFSKVSDLTKDGTPQHKALRWISDFDPFQVHTDSDSILQRYALAVFFFTTNSDHNPNTDMRNGAKSLWTHDDYWMSEKGVCMWYGVNCPSRVHNGKETTQYNENIDIVDLSLPKNNVIGTLPEEIGALESLTSLQLPNNELEGSIPLSVTTLEMLEILDLSRNSFTGIIPEGVDNLLSLTELLLSKNSLDGSIPKQIGNLLDLEILDLWGNQLGGTIPNDIVSCKKLTFIDVSYNSLHGTIPKDIKNLSSLTVLAGNRNTFNGELPSLQGVNNLNTLDLSLNEFSGTFPSGYGDLTNLRNLHLNNNKLGKMIPEQIGKLTKLENLSLQQNQFTGELPDVFWEMKNLRELELSSNSFLGQLPADIDDLSELKLLLLNDNKFSGSIPPSYDGLGKLEVMHLHNNAFDGNIPDGFQMLSSLRNLQLSGNGLKGTIPKVLGEATNLEVIELQHNVLEGYVPSDLSSLPRLQILRVEGNELIGTVPNGLCDNVDSGILLSFTADCAPTNMPGQHIVCPCCTECFEP